MYRVAIAALVLGMSAAQAQTVDCDNAMTQRDMNHCAALAFEAADEDLNAAYAEARAFMRELDTDQSSDEAGAEAALRDAQRAWIPYRDKACAAEGFLMRGGSAEAMLVLGCKARLTEQRAQDLWTLAEGAEG